MPQDSRDSENLKIKLTILSSVLTLGHDAFRKTSIEAVALHIVNNTRNISNYGRSSLIDMRGLFTAVVAVSGQPVPKQDSEYCGAARRLAAAFPKLDAPKLIKAGNNEGIPPEIIDDISKIFEGRPAASMLLIPLSYADSKVASGVPFIWIVEFFEGEAPHDTSVLALLAQHYSEALWLRSLSNISIFSGFVKLKNLKPIKTALIVFAILLFLLFAVRVRQYAVSNFEIAPGNGSIVYSRLNGTIARVIKSNGEKVKAGEKVMEFDDAELNFKLANAIKEYEQVSAELDMNRLKSFSAPEAIAKAQLLDIKRKQDAIDIEKTRWMLSMSVLSAPADGTVVMEEKERITGRAIKPGEKLFEIIPPNDLIAEVFLSERDASVIGKDMIVKLYLHTQPETPIRGKLISVSPKPTLTYDRRFCYVLKFKPDNPAGLICGMRGVARVGGDRVSLGYYLFRSVVLWWRKI